MARVLEAAWQAQHELFERSFVALMELPLLVIAALNGHADGGGLEMALAWSAFNQACEPGQTLTDAVTTARAIADNGPLSVRQAKKSIQDGLQLDLLSGYRFEIEAYNRLVDTEDRHEGRARLKCKAQAGVPRHVTVQLLVCTRTGQAGVNASGAGPGQRETCPDKCSPKVNGTYFGCRHPREGGDPELPDTLDSRLRGNDGGFNTAK